MSSDVVNADGFGFIFVGVGNGIVGFLIPFVVLTAVKYIFAQAKNYKAISYCYGGSTSDTLNSSEDKPPRELWGENGLWAPVNPPYTFQCARHKYKYA